MRSPRHTLILMALILLGQAGCQHYGPRTITADRIPYNAAIAASWKEQTLLNIVKLRYADTPFFVDVPQITSGYTLQGAAVANAGIFPPVSNLASFAQQLGATLNLQAGYQDRPTISYVPQTGSQFIRNLTQPINPGSVLFLLQSGYPADVVFDLTVDSINGVRNRSVSGGQLRPADPEFIQVVQTIRKAQITGHVGIRVEHDKDKKDSVAFFFHDQGVDPALAKELAEVRKILRVDPDRRDFRVVFGGTAKSPNEIAILSRSVLRVLTELSTFVEPPIEHLAGGIAPGLGDLEADPKAPLRVFSGAKKPHDPFVAVCYEGQWFWIDKSDFLSKRTMAYVLVLLALADTGAKDSLPVITISAN
ncbi:MAG: hypothetical protein L0Y71_11585 [Gemmataceae bacterium]|nr:hypothetical protein [Gemmataceae bacterium]